MPGRAKHRVKFMGSDQAEMGYYPRAKGRGKIKKKLQESIRICRECGMVSVGKRWFHGLLESKHLGLLIERTYCPGCEAVRKRHIEGFVELRTNLIQKSKFEVLGLIQRIEEETMMDNPFNRIIEIAWPQDNIVRIQTTTDYLARMIGKKFKKAYKGDLTMKFSGVDHYVHVIWTDNDYDGNPEERGMARIKPKTKARKPKKSQIKAAKRLKIVKKRRDARRKSR